MPRDVSAAYNRPHLPGNVVLRTALPPTGLRILLDLVPLKAGGGIQVGLGVIDELERQGGFGHTWYAIATRGSVIHERVSRTRFVEAVEAVPRSLPQRLLYERMRLPKVLETIQPDVVYSQFGAGIPTQGIPIVVGSAYSNLYYPEIDFWGNWPLAHRTLYRLRDRFRLRRTLAADGLIFESTALAARAKRLYGLPDDRVTVVRPSPSATISSSHNHPPTRNRCGALPAGFKVLMLSGWHMNKGLEIVPRIASMLRDEHAIADCVFVLSVPEDHPRSAEMRREAERRGVLKNIVFFGSVPQDGCAEVYRATDATLLLSVLESFSNNIIESWTMGRPLVITDAEWAHGLCGDAAWYVRRESASDIACKLAALIRSESTRQHLTEKGYIMARSYPTLGEKTAAYVRFVEQIATLGVR